MFGIALICIVATGIVYMYGEFKQSLQSITQNYGKVEIVEIALSTWTLDPDVSNDSGLGLNFPALTMA
jgi:hypothetical protein